MSILLRLDQFYEHMRQNRWLSYFYIFCRFVFVIVFFPSGITKIIGERFASGLSIHHPMGQYLEVLHHTSYYYTII